MVKKLSMFVSVIFTIIQFLGELWEFLIYTTYYAKLSKKFNHHKKHTFKQLTDNFHQVLTRFYLLKDIIIYCSTSIRDSV